MPLLRTSFLACCLAWLLAGGGPANAQTPASPIAAASVNGPYLEYLIKAQVDSLRLSRALPALVSDSVLYRAATDHAAYLAAEPVTSPRQKHPRKKTAQDRAYFHGARNYLADENLLSFPLRRTYGETAREVVRTWAASAGHLRNLTDADFQITGVAVKAHQHNGRFIVVQDFARVLWKYTFYTNPHLFPYDTLHPRTAELAPPAGTHPAKLPWRLKSLDYRRTEGNSIWTAFRSQRLQLQADHANRVIFARSVTPLQLLHAMKKRRDGIAVELVDFKSYQCGGGGHRAAASRRNGASSVNGTVMKPVYKQELLSNLRKQKREFKRDKARRLRPWRFQYSAKAARLRKEIRKEAWKPEFTSVPVGDMLRVDSSGLVVANFLLLHKRRIIGAIHYTDVCGDLSFTDSVAFAPELSDRALAFTPDNAAFEFRVPFARNSALPDARAMQAIRDTLRNHQLDRIQIDAYTSVEGRGVQNEQLHRSRADSLVAGLRDYTHQDALVDVKTSENWPLFYAQIDSSENRAWRDWPVEQIRRELQKPDVLAAWAARLNQQRQARVRIETHLQVRDTLDYLRRHPAPRNPAQAAALQAFYYRQWQQGRLPADSLLSARYPATAAYADLRFNQLLLDYQLNHARWTADQWQQHWQTLQTALSGRATGLAMRHYAVAFMLSEWTFVQEQGYAPDNVLKLIEQVVRDEKYKPLEKKLKAVFYLKALPYYHREGNYRKVRGGTQFLTAYYREQPAVSGSAALTLGLANYLIEIEAFKIAGQVLDTYLKKTGFDEDVYVQFLKLGFVHPDYQKNRTYTRLLLEAAQKLPQAKWCDLFIGECRINFQVFDDEQLRSLYCEKCVGVGNAAAQRTK